MREATGQKLADQIEETLEFNDGLEFRILMSGGDGKYSVLLYAVPNPFEKMHQKTNPGKLLAELRFEEWAIGQETDHDIRQLARMIYNWFVKVINGQATA